MIVLLIGNKTLYKMKLPANIEGSFVLSDPKTKNNLINIDAENGSWVLCDNSSVKLYTRSNERVSKATVKNDDSYFIDYEKERKIIYFTDICDKTFSTFKIKEDTKLIVGRNNTCNILYNNPYMQPEHFRISFVNGNWQLEIGQNAFVYLNDKLVMTNITRLNFGDQIFCYGLKICILNGYVLINNPLNLVTFNNTLERCVINAPSEDIDEEEEINEEDLYKDNDYYFNTPRLRRFNGTYELNVATPPAKQEPPEQNLLLTLGPAITMGLVSLITAFTNVSKVMSGKSNWTVLITPLATLMGSLLWPNLTRRFQKKNIIRKEKIRKEKYRKYIADKKEEIEKEKLNQTAILKEGLIPLQECYNIILNKKRTLWERKINQQDFLTIRVGTGDRPLDMNVNWNENEFEIERDPLIDEASKMVEEAKMLHDVPIGYSFFNKKATALMGDMNLVRVFTKDMLLQLMSFHSYDELKIVVFTNDENKKEWDAIKTLPHLFSNDKSIRFFGSNEDDQKMISNFLEEEFINRINNQKNVAIENENESETYSPYYLILTDDYMKIRKLGICDMILDEKTDLGFGFVILDTMLSHLPSKCINFIMIDKNYSGILRNELNDYYQQDFKKELDDSFDLQKCSEVLSNIPIEFQTDLRYIPTSLSFLEMYGVGKIEQLNIFNRWRMNDPTKSLRAPIGVNDQGNLIYLDLHEKYHGPHGLIAGTTGSGKSEFIITYILSMCANYSPNEVAFILIDYKGGGLAGAFENKKTGVRLPHLAGTITNLDKNELNRTLVSIQSELTRRQTVFNDARDELGESTIDIYKYQKFFREGKLKTPMPHLFIICDEFAELKQQQPDFMDNLISAARIGRSLGVHLILATQKPSGVVNEQIWSNTKFRVCLKVANPGDSNEVIKCPDASEITNAGRFYLQVGQNEIFVLGQSGWAGATYKPSDIVKQEYDRSITYIDEVGNVIRSVSSEAKNKKQTTATGDELTNILKYITDLAAKENLKADNLWLDSIPKDLSIKDVLSKYKIDGEHVNAIIGEYDDPSSQTQGLLTLPLYELHNTIVYGLTAANKETFIRTVVCSTSALYSSEDVNFYIIDFGSESFRVFNKFPHVGGVVFQSESDKLDKLFKMLDEEIINRKNLFVDYNGDYDIYNKNSGKKLPLYVVIINNYDVLKEQYASYEEMLLKLSREGKRYGVLFIITTTSKSGLFSRFLKNFEDEYVLDMNDKDEYSDILGRLGNVYPSDNPGRGLFKRDKILEYQVAQICDEENTVQYIKDEAEQLNKNNTYKAKQIPVLPEVLTLDMILDSNINIKNIPFGMEKETLKTAYYNFSSNKSILISSNELENTINPLKYLLKTFISMKNIAPILLDFEGDFESLKPYCSSYISTDFEKNIDTAINFIDEKIKGSQYYAVLIVCGLEKFKSKLDTNKITQLQNKINEVDNCKAVFIDTAFVLKKLAFEPWYTSLVQGNNALWIGAGIMDQGSVKISTFEKKYSEKINNEFGWLVKNGDGSLIKLVNGDAHEE